MRAHDQWEDAPPQSWRLLRKFIPKSLQPLVRGFRKRLLKQGYRDTEPFRHTYAYTYASHRRQDSILDKASGVVRNKIEGDFVECGVCDGGTAALLAFAARDDDRKIHLFDAWSGLPATVEKDGKESEKWVGEVVGSPKRVERVLKKVGANRANIVFHKGWFSKTIPVSRIGKVAFLHVDCDFYEPTKLVLDSFFPKMVRGGWVQIDDYTSFVGCRCAVDEFMEAHPELDLVVEESAGGAIYFQIP